MYPFCVPIHKKKKKKKSLPPTHFSMGEADSSLIIGLAIHYIVGLQLMTVLNPCTLYGFQVDMWTLENLTGLWKSKEKKKKDATQYHSQSIRASIHTKENKMLSAHCPVHDTTFWTATVGIMENVSMDLWMTSLWKKAVQADCNLHIPAQNTVPGRLHNSSWRARMGAMLDSSQALILASVQSAFDNTLNELMITSPCHTQMAILLISFFTQPADN